MAGSVIIAGARYADRQALRRAGRLLCGRARWVRDQGCARTRRPHARADRLRVHGPRAAGRHRQITARQQRCTGAADDRAGHDRQQGVLVRPQLDLPRRSDGAGRRSRHRGRRRHGIDDPVAVPPPRRTWRLPLRRRHVVDSCAYDGLFCAFDKMAMGGATEKYAASANLAREPQDEMAAQSHERAAAAIKDGKFAEEIVPIEIPQRKGDPVLFDTDEGVRPGTTAESLGALRPAFDKAGNITAGNASQISDGGSAVIVTSKATAEKLGVAPLGEIVATARSLVPTRRCSRSRHGRSSGRSRRPARASATSTCSSSTRRSPPWAWRQWPTWASRTTSST